MKRRDLFVGLFASVVALVLPKPKDNTWEGTNITRSWKYAYRYNDVQQLPKNSKINIVEVLRNPQLTKSLAAQGKQIDTKELVRLFQETIQRS